MGGEAANPVSTGTGWWGPTQGSVDSPEPGAMATTTTVLLRPFLEPRALKICWALASARVSIHPVPLGRLCRLRALVSLSDPKGQAGTGRHMGQGSHTCPVWGSAARLLQREVEL